MVKLQTWSFGERKVPIHDHCSQIHSDSEWLYLLRFYLRVNENFLRIQLCGNKWWVILDWIVDLIYMALIRLLYLPKLNCYICSWGGIVLLLLVLLLIWRLVWLTWLSPFLTPRSILKVSCGRRCILNRQNNLKLTPILFLLDLIKVLVWLFWIKPTM